jgi:hypothetical protein
MAVTLYREQLALFDDYAQVVASATGSALREFLVEVHLDDMRACFTYECPVAAGLLTFKVVVTRLDVALGIGHDDAGARWQQRFEIAAKELARLRAGSQPGPVIHNEEG